MSYIRDYSKIEDPIEKERAALLDVKDWFGGEAKFLTMVGLIRACYATESEVAPGQPGLAKFKASATFVGVHGYPAEALYYYIWPRWQCRRCGLSADHLAHDLLHKCQRARIRE